MSERDAILALLPADRGGEAPQTFGEAGRSPVGDLWGLFAARLDAVGGRMAEWSELALLEGRKWTVERDVVVPAEAGVFEPAAVWEADLGIERARLAVAETGTLVLTHEPGRRRLVSLAPPHSVVVIGSADVVQTLEGAFARLPQENAALVTGPSRTADIEGVLVRGVHGPRSIWVIVEPEPTAHGDQ
ncbi:MAG: lactate utilization protein [Armatimonadetes bacterium]|nr:lactate utilization protein [Armatimonadota bacterium]